MRTDFSLRLAFFALLCALFLTGVATFLVPAPAEGAPGYLRAASSPEAFAASFRAMTAFQADSVPRDYIAFGDLRGYMHVLRKKGDGFTSAWSTFYLGSPVKEIVAEDIDGNGVLNLVVITSAGRMFIFNAETRQLLWENTKNDFESVSGIAIDQLDSDRAQELVLCADSRLLILDGEKLLREYQSADQFKADYLVIGDVDDDDEKEIVLDSGFVVNATTLSIEWQTDFFGTRLTLRDIDSDGVEELICESSGGALRVYDLDIRQEKTVY
ncbi:MAG: hypothetical protein JSW03_07270 [Candidatus Eiseniibacteriota bacterium]|nr:MAG: hypothetical protein JSW03_07270 [Candidatus Eisenbacteria bacterium]